jgi:hypothetical protein
MTSYRTTTELTRIRDLVRSRAIPLAHVFRRTDLVDWDVEPTVTVTMMRRDWWARLHHGVYVDAQVLREATARERHRIDAAASIAALSRPAYAFGISAAIAHDLSLPGSLVAPVELIRPLGHDGRALSRRISARDRLDAATVRGHRLVTDDVTTVGGIATVNRLLAAVSAAARLDDEWAVAVLDAAAWRDETAIDSMAAYVERFAHLRGIGTVRRALPLARTGAQTPLETFSRLRLVEHGLPEPQLQVPLYDDDGLIGYVDALWLELGVVGEADGLVKYGGGSNSVVAEKRREDRIRARGYAVVRWTWDEIMQRPWVVVARIREAARWSARRAG